MYLPRRSVAGKLVRMLFFIGYLYMLLNSWLAWAGGLLSVNEISGWFFKRSWSWPRENPFKAAAVVWAVAQYGAYQGLYEANKAQRDSYEQKLNTTESEKRILESEIVGLKQNNSNL
jgi:hypothetical protein